MSNTVTFCTLQKKCLFQYGNTAKDARSLQTGIWISPGLCGLLRFPYRENTQLTNSRLWISARCSLGWISAATSVTPIKNNHWLKKRHANTQLRSWSCPAEPACRLHFIYIWIWWIWSSECFERKRKTLSIVCVSGCSEDYCVHTHSKQSPSHLRVRLIFSDVSCSHLAPARLVQHRELEKGAVVISSGLRYLSQPSSISA